MTTFLQLGVCLEGEGKIRNIFENRRKYHTCKRPINKQNSISFLD